MSKSKKTVLKKKSTTPEACIVSQWMEAELKPTKDEVEVLKRHELAAKLDALSRRTQCACGFLPADQIVIWQGKSALLFIKETVSGSMPSS
jgi:hypothetical protein